MQRRTNRGELPAQLPRLYQRSEVLTAGKRERAPPLVRRDPTSTSHRRRRLVLVVAIDLENKACPCCSGELHRIDEDGHSDSRHDQFLPWPKWPEKSLTQARMER